MLIDDHETIDTDVYLYNGTKVNEPLIDNINNNLYQTKHNPRPIIATTGTAGEAVGTILTPVCITKPCVAFDLF